MTAGGDFVQPWGANAYVTWISLTIYIIPVAILSVCYGLISFTIWQNLKLKTRKDPNVTLTSKTVLSRVSSVKLISKAKIRTVKMTFVIVLAYVVCWAPFFFVQMWSVWDPEAPREASAFIIAMLLASLNSCCNPWIYMFFAGHLFHDMVQRFLCCSSNYLKSSQRSCDLNASPSAFIIAMLLASLNSCCNPWIYMFFAGHLFHDMVQRFLCCWSNYLKSSQRSCDLNASRKSNSSMYMRSITQTSTT
ncbi:UNVERIFIED_CONTAM: hypothetical protein FKN15_006654 [Acipenser sinensis]